MKDHCMFPYFHYYRNMELEDATPYFAALSQETRLEIFQALIKQGPDGIAAGKLTEDLNASPSTISFHLKELERSGLVSARREGRFIYYIADYAGIRSFVDFLLVECCQGDPRLSGPYVIREKN